MKNILFTLFILLIFSCARIGSPDGGPKDTTPPKVLRSSPDSMERNVSTDLKEIKIYFDKWVKLKDPNKQLIISPAVEKIKKIIPTSTPNKYILIQWEDTLKANTTYNFNFGNSIIDNNEGNELPYYQLIFSTGKTIDSLYISGYVDDILKPRRKNNSDEKFTHKKQEKQEKPIIVGLYKIEDKDINMVGSGKQNDETIDNKIEYKNDIYTKKPYYITQVEPDGYFELNYLASGNYLLVAFQDENQNMIYDSGKENVAFLSDTLHLGDEVKHIKGLRLLLSSPQKKHRFIEMKSIAGGIGIIFEGKADSLQLKHVDDVLSDFKINYKPKSDTAFVWINPKSENFSEGSTNLKFSYFNEQKEKVDTISTYFKPNDKDQLKLNNNSGSVILPDASLKLTANMYLDSIDVSKWELKSEVDSTIVIPFSAKISDTNPFEILVNAKMKTGEKYKFLVEKQSVFSYYYSNEKTILFNFAIGKNEDYGSLVFHIKNVPKVSFWIQLLNDNFDVVKEQKVKNKKEIRFSYLNTQTYSVRILVDNNNNGVWDGADFENRIQPEDAYLFKKKLTVKPLWEIVEDWDLLDTSPLAEQENENNLMPSSGGIKKIDEREKSNNQKKQNEDNHKNNLLEQQQQSMQLPREMF